MNFKEFLNLFVCTMAQMSGGDQAPVWALPCITPPSVLRNAAAEKEKGCRQAGGATAHGKKPPETVFSFLYGPNMTNAGLPHKISNFMVDLSTHEFSSFLPLPPPDISG